MNKLDKIHYAVLLVIVVLQVTAIVMISKVSSVDSIVKPSQQYTNWQFNYSINYPNNYNLEDNSRDGNDGYLHDVQLLKDGVHPMLNIRVSGSPFASEDYLGSSVGKITVDEFVGNKYVIDNGRCDGPGCSLSSVTYTIKKDGLEYVLDFIGKTELTTEDEWILSSFDFVKR